MTFCQLSPSNHRWLCQLSVSLVPRFVLPHNVQIDSPKWAARAKQRWRESSIRHIPVRSGSVSRTVPVERGNPDTSNLTSALLWEPDAQTGWGQRRRQTHSAGRGTEMDGREGWSSADDGFRLLEMWQVAIRSLAVTPVENKCRVCKSQVGNTDVRTHRKDKHNENDFFFFGYTINIG